MIKVSDFIAKFIAGNNNIANDIFLVSGGGNMHLIDSIGRNRCLNYICNHHEQACAIAAEGYARVTNKIGVAVVTTGPGGTNAITGVYGAWVDSIPILIISGQVKFETTIASQPKLRLRQLGDQEVNIVDITKPITKYAVMVKDKYDIKYHLQKAVYLAKKDRPGPVWIDIPLDIQGALINEGKLREFVVPKRENYDNKIDKVLTYLNNAKRPVILVGNGVRLSNSVQLLKEIVEKLNIPLLTTISGIDIVESSHPNFFGRPGILGERMGNFVVQNSDLLIVLGTRLNLRILSFNWEYFAREAKKIMVDADCSELNKKTFKPDIKIETDLNVFLNELHKKTDHIELNIQDWLGYCKKIKNKYPRVTCEQRDIKNFVSSYYFPEVLSKHLKSNAVVITGNGIAYTSTHQAYHVKNGQRLFTNVGCAAMGYDLPAAIGACLANSKRDVICLTGDGSIQMNIQELQTIIHNNLPIKIFMYNNLGYLSIRITQSTYFDNNFVGEGKSSGVSFPDMLALAKIYGFKTERISNHTELEEKLPFLLKLEGPLFCELMLDPNEQIGPKVASYKKPDGSMISKPLEDLAPFLPRAEFYENMIINPIEE